MSEQRRAAADGPSGGPGVTHPAVRPGRPMLAVAPDDPIGDAVALMREHRVRRIPVVSAGRCVALLTERDVLRSLASASDIDAATARSVASVCPGPAPAVEAGSPLPAMAAALLSAGSDAAVVVSGGTLVGVIDTSDVLGAIRTRRVESAAAAAELDWLIPRPR